MPNENQPQECDFFLLSSHTPYVAVNVHWAFVFVHFRTFHILNRAKQAGNVALISTIPLTDEEERIEVKNRPSKQAKMPVLSSPSLVFNGDIPV